MKKVLLVLVAVVVIAGAVVGSKIYSDSQASEMVDKLKKFEISDDESYEAFLNPKRLKWRKLAKKKKNNVIEPAPLYALKVKGEDIIPGMSTLLKDATQPANVREAAAVVIGHTKKKNAIDPLIEGLKEKEGRLGEACAYMLGLLDFNVVPSRITDALSGVSDAKVRKNIFLAIMMWVTEEEPRMKNEVPMETVIKGLDEKDKDTLLLIFAKMKRLQFRFIKKGSEEASPGEKLSTKLLPLIANKDEALAAAATAALEFQYSYMDDPIKVETFKKVAPYTTSGKKKYVRMNGIRLVAKLNLELAHNKATIIHCDLDSFIPLLEEEDIDILGPVLDTFILCGMKREHRKAVQKFLERVSDEGLKKKAQEAVEKIGDREEEG